MTRETPDQVLPGLLITAAEQLLVASKSRGFAHYEGTAHKLREHSVRLEKNLIRNCRCERPDFRGNRKTSDGDAACLQCGGKL